MTDTAQHDRVTPRRAPRPAPRRLPWPLVLLLAPMVGLLWGINARLWMRFVSTDPEFSWSGTIFIVTAFAIAAFGQGGAYLGRRAGKRRPALTVLRVLGVVTLLPLGMAAGAVMLPTFLLVPLVLTQCTWPRIARVALVVIASAGPLFVTISLFGDFGPVRATAALAWFAAIYAGIIRAAELSLGPQRDGWHAPPIARNVGLVALVGLPLLVVLTMTGV